MLRVMIHGRSVPMPSDSTAGCFSSKLPAMSNRRGTLSTHSSRLRGIIQSQSDTRARMELRLIARILLRYWWLVLIPTVIAAAFAAPALLSGRASAGGFATSIRYSAAQQPDAQPPRDGD